MGGPELVTVVGHDFPAEAEITFLGRAQNFSVKCRRCGVEIGQTFQPENRLGLQERYNAFWEGIQRWSEPCRVPVVGW